MKLSVAKLVNEILEHLVSATGKAPSEKAMRTFLLRRGYNRRDIESAIEFINAHLVERPVYSRQSLSVRHLAFYESTKITQDAYQAMTRLELMGLLDPMEREVLLERFIHSEGQADMEALDFALSYFIGTARNAETQQTMISVFEGYSPTLH